MSPGRAAAAIAVGAFLVYNANFRLIVEGDTVPARYLPFAIVRDRSLALDGLAKEVSRVPPNRDYHEPYWLARSRTGRLVSAYPVVTPILVSPLYAAAAALAGPRFTAGDGLPRRAEEMEKVSASLIAALSAALMFLLLRRRVPERPAALLAIAYAFGTATWAISSQALWQHGTAEILLIAALLAATAPPGAAAAAIGGAAAGLLAMNRPPDAAFAAAVLGAFAVRDRARAWPAFAAAALAAAPFVVYNVLAFGSVAGGYATAGLVDYPSFFARPIPPGLAGLLLSPSKGLLVFSPFLVFLALRLRRPVKDGEFRVLDRFLAAAVAVHLLAFAKMDWRAGSCYGPRYLSDVIPALVWLLAPAVSDLAQPLRSVFVACVAFSIAVQGIGAFCYPRGGSDRLYYPPGLSRGRFPRAAWLPADAAFLVEARGGIAPPELFVGRKPTSGAR